ncbi:MAG TPA: C13 family peptidase, partial [Terricaulis sp.]|nr:C13 family peptidase [Terricaulis sp.]
AILNAHFGAAGRSIMLSAGGDGPRTYPAATPDNLSAAIGQVGSLIDPNEDLVVVFITSHGSPDGSAALREHNRLVGALRPTHLRDMLVGAGIRTRVVIVSACFSGAFIAPLMDDNTIVLTAAAPDRSSFGCQPQNNWTFFGDALFNQNLRNGGSIVQAFDRAKVLIERWEREQNLSPPSNPQRHVGARAAEVVRRAERR